MVPQGDRWQLAVSVTFRIMGLTNLLCHTTVKRKLTELWGPTTSHDVFGKSPCLGHYYIGTGLLKCNAELNLIVEMV